MKTPTIPDRLLISDPVHIRIIRALRQLPADEVEGVAEELEQCVRELDEEPVEAG